MSMTCHNGTDKPRYLDTDWAEVTGNCRLDGQSGENLSARHSPTGEGFVRVGEGGLLPRKIGGSLATGRVDTTACCKCWMHKKQPLIS